MHEQLWFTALLNHLFAGPVTGLLRTLHLEPKYPDAPIANSVAMELLVFIFLVIVFALVRSRLSVDRPGADRICQVVALQRLFRKYRRH